MEKIKVEKDSVDESYRWAYGWRVVDGKCSPPAKNFPLPEFVQSFHVADDGRKCFLKTKDGFEIVDEDFFEQPLITYIGNSQWGLAGGKP